MIEQSDIIWSVIVGICTIVMMAGFIITFILIYQRKRIAQEKQLFEIQKEYQKELLATALDSEESERRRIAQDLHDDIGVMLSLTKMSLNQCAAISKKDMTIEPTLFDKTKHLLDDTILHVRKITRDLVPTTLEQFGLQAAIEEFLDKIQGGSELSVHFNTATTEFPRFKSKIELSLFRIMQELVNNAVKHSQCTEIHITLKYTLDTIVLEVWDNGIGYDAEILKNRGGHGLRNIESRVSILKGIVEYLQISKGTLAKISVSTESEPNLKPHETYTYLNS